MDSRISWPSMETDCLVEIFMRLGLDDLTLVVPFICKSWLAAARHPLCWRKLDFRRLDLLPWSDFSKAFALHRSLPYFTFTYFLKFAINQSCRSVTEIRFPLKFASLEDLVIASNESSKLKSVALPILSQSEEEQIPQLVCKWKDLEKLELELKPSNFIELVKNLSLNCRKFSRLRISGSSIHEDDALAIAKYLPELKELELISSYLPKEVMMIILNGCRKLDGLNVIDCTGFDGEEDEEINSRVSHIKDLKMVGCKLYYEYDCDESENSSSNLCSYTYIL